MKLFTIKDLIKYNNPCKVCLSSKGCWFGFKTIPTNEEGKAAYTDNFTIIDGKIHINLSTKYKSRLTLVINPKTNKFILNSNSNGRKLFKKFQEEKYLVAEIKCNTCHSEISTDFLEFDEDVIRPVKLHSECIEISTREYRYHISTSFTTNKTFIMCSKVEEGKVKMLPFMKEVQAIPLSKLKDRSAIIRKIKFIMTFS